MAGFSAAAGKDVRDEFRFWGFDIDDEFYDQIMPMMESRIEIFAIISSTGVFSDGRRCSRSQGQKWRNMNKVRFALIAVAALSLFAPCLAAEEIDCGFYNEIEIADAVGDATPGAPSYVDILGLEIRQFRDRVQFRWRSAGNPYNADACTSSSSLTPIMTPRPAQAGSFGTRSKSASTWTPMSIDLMRPETG